MNVSVPLIDKQINDNKRINVYVFEARTYKNLIEDSNEKINLIKRYDVLYEYFEKFRQDTTKNMFKILRINSTEIKESDIGKLMKSLLIEINKFTEVVSYLSANKDNLIDKPKYKLDDADESLYRIYDYITKFSEELSQLQTDYINQ